MSPLFVMKAGFGGRGVPPAYNVLAGETPAPHSVFENLNTDPCGVLYGVP